MADKVKNTCPKCQTPLAQGTVEEGPPAIGTARMTKWSEPTAGSGRRIKYTNWYCPTCRKTRMVVPEGA